MPMKIIDIHIHPLLTFVTEDDLLRELREARVDFGILLALDVDPQNLDSPKVQHTLLQRLTNLYVWNARVITNMRDFLQRIKTDNSRF